MSIPESKNLMKRCNTEAKLSPRKKYSEKAFAEIEGSFDNYGAKTSQSRNHYSLKKSQIIKYIDNSKSND